MGGTLNTLCTKLVTRGLWSFTNWLTDS